MSSYVLAQIIGAFAVAFMVTSYINTKKERYLFFQITCNIFYGLQFFLLNAYSAMGICIITIIKSILFYFYEKKGHKVPLWALLATEIATIIFGIIIFDGFDTLLPIIISCIYTYATWQKNLKLTYLTGTGISILWIIYYAIIGAFVSISGGVFELCASIIGVIKLNKLKKQSDNKETI